MTFYAETRTQTGKWMPCTFDAMPSIKTVGNRHFLQRAEGPGAELRFIPKKVNRGLEGKSLEDLRNSYSPDGCFRGTRDRSAEEIEADGFVTWGMGS